MKHLTVEIPEFLTHVNKSANKHLKINNNAIYSGNMHRFTRSKIVKDLHDYISLYLEPYKGLKISTPISITYKIHTVLNHGSISLRKGILCWKPVTKSYKPTWDIENLASLWIKTINDALTINEIIIDDNVSIVKKISYEFIEVKDINNRKIEIIIEEHSSE